MPTAHTHPNPTLDTDVLIVGAGPTGLTLATALAQRRVRTLVIDRQAEGANTSRAAVIHARTLEVLEPLGLARRLVARGLQTPRFTIRDRDRALVTIDFDSLPSRYPYTLMLSQAVTEAVLRARLAELGTEVLRPRSLVALTQDTDSVLATLDDGSQVRARYCVGADGLHSAVREAAGIGFDGGAYDESFVLADVRLASDAGLPKGEVILFFSPAGLVVLAPLPDGLHRVVATVDNAPERPDAAFVQSLLDARAWRRVRARVTDIVWGSRFRVQHRVADRYRLGRVLLAGDAAHVHSPAGGQGMNMGMLDATCLSEALVAALGGDVAALDAYANTRRPVAQQVVAFAHRLTRLATLPPALRPIRNALLRLLSLMPAYRRALSWRLSGLVYR